MPRATNAAAIEHATGKPWQEWLAWFEEIGAKSLTHEELTQRVYEQNVPTWWAEQIVAAYEEKRN